MIEKESEQKLLRMDNDLRKYFQESVLPLLESMLDIMDYSALNYLDEIVDKETSKKAVELVSANIYGTQDKLSDMGIVLMETGETTIPDFVVHKKRTRRRAKQYPALIGVTNRTIEIYDPRIYTVIKGFAYNWEFDIQTDFLLIGVEITIIKCFD